MTINIMIDIETMGTSENAPIVSLGAVQFDSDGIYPSGYYGVWTLKSSMSYGFVPEASTIMWWMDRSITARMGLIKATGTIKEELLHFHQWLSNKIGEDGKKELRIWCNGANFDGVLLRHTIKKVIGEPLWHHGQERCYRTIRKLFRDDWESIATANYNHIAIDDAITQALELIPILNKYHLWEN